jgi:hypothetical protein
MLHMPHAEGNIQKQVQKQHTVNIFSTSHTGTD